MLRTTITVNLITLYALTVHLYSYWSLIYLLLFWFRCASLTCLLLVCLHRCVLVLSKAGCQCCTPCNTQSFVFQYFLFTVLQVVVCVEKWKIKLSPKCPIICVAKQQYSEEDLSSHCGKRIFFLKFHPQVQKLCPLIVLLNLVYKKNKQTKKPSCKCKKEGEGLAVTQSWTYSP